MLFRSATVSAMESAYELHKNDIEAICLRSYGGRLNAADKLYDFIAETGLPTCMASYYEFDPTIGSRVPELIKSDVTRCSSACPPLLYASNQRIALGDTFKVKLHQPGKKYCIDGEMTKKDFTSLQKNNAIRDMLRRTDHVSLDKRNEFYQRVLRRKYSEKDLYILPFEDAKQLELFNDIRVRKH